MMQASKNSRTVRVTGFTLVEVLAALAIFSVGLLGLAGLQLRSMSSNQGAFVSTVASLQAMDAGERMRANSVGVTNGDYDLLVTDVGDPGCINLPAGCTAAQVAQYDYWIWNQGQPPPVPPPGEKALPPATGNARLLPGGEGVICLDRTPNDGVSRANHGCEGALVNATDPRIYAVKIWWDDDKNPATPMRRHALSVLP